MTDKKHVIHDEECREYAEGWNACNAGKLLFSNPYGTAHDSTQYYCWKRGYDDCDVVWNDGKRGIPRDKKIYPGMPSAINGGLNSESAT